MKDSHRINKILSHVMRGISSTSLLDILTDDLSGSDLISILLDVYRNRALKLTVNQVLQQYKSDRFVQPPMVQLMDLRVLELAAFELLPNKFEVIELSPVCPLGTCSVLASVNQNNVVTTIRNTEVCSDVTNVLALEASKRRSIDKESRLHVTKLCTGHRQLRAQVFDGPASFAHFHVLALCTAGRTKGNYTVEIEAVIEHVNYYLDLFLMLASQPYTFERIEIDFLPMSRRIADLLNNIVIQRINTNDDSVIINVDTDYRPETNYYCELRFRINLADSSGNSHNIVDGGFTTWSQQLINDKKEYLLTSGMGTERFIAVFKNKETIR